MLLTMPVFAWVLLGGLILFGLAVVVRMSFDLAKGAKGLAASARKGTGRLRSAVAEVKQEADEASRRAKELGGSARKARSRG